jgi:xylulokinase
MPLPGRSMPAFIGLDVGTSSVKAIMGSAGGVLLDSFSGHHVTARPSPGAAEQDPADWLRLVEAALARFAAHPRAVDVVAIGVTSQVNTHVFCDAHLAPLHPAITWQDTRPTPQAGRLDAAISLEDKISALGAPIPIDASHALARMAWMKETRPELWADTAHVLLPKDYVIARLSGRTVADPISAVGLVGTDLGYAPAVLDLLAGAAKVLPDLRDPLDIAGPIRPGRPFAGVPIATGTMDAWAGMFGLGVADEGAAMYLSGTSDVLGLISGDRTGTEGIITFPPWRGITLHAGPTQSGGASLAWAARLLGQDVAQLGALAAQAPIKRQSPLFLPHLEGERAPLWDSSSRGVFAGMTSGTGPEDLAACVMEGVAFSARLALEAIERSGNRAVPRLRHGGGGATSNTWCQIRANALGRTLDRVAVSEVGAMGALVMAATAAGELADLHEATKELVAFDECFAADPQQAALADVRFEVFKKLYRALGPVNEAQQSPA